MIGCLLNLNVDEDGNVEVDIELINKRLLVLDLDHTLIYSEYISDDQFPEIDYDFEYNSHYVSIRPYTYNFLYNIWKYYDIFVWSAGSPDYVDKIVDELFHFIPIVGVYNINWCDTICDRYYKPLIKIVNEYDIHMDDILIVDNLSFNFFDNPQNGILMPEYRGDRNDNVLVYLYNYLLELTDVSDIIILHKEDWFKEIEN